MLLVKFVIVKLATCEIKGVNILKKLSHISTHPYPEYQDQCLVKAECAETRCAPFITQALPDNEF